GFFESSDGGKSWKVQRWFPDGLVRLVSNPSDGANYFVVTSHGEMFRTYDRGVSWTRLTEGFRQFPKADRIAGVALDIMNPSTLYTASPYGLLRSQNGGTTWSSANLIVPPQSSGANAVTVNPKNSRQIFAAVGAQIYRSDDFGEHWGILNSPTSDQIRMIYVDPEDTSIVYAVVGR
ncbi:MAG: hypothetical protein HYT40_02695, partial [Candidatus Sungbacteria bacterium]|nr:hypothetical protein [Candidatus Sungbacteria bacterium]